MQLERRVVVLMEPELHEGAKSLAAALGVSVGELVRQAVRTRVALATPPAPAVGDALAFLWCRRIGTSTGSPRCGGSTR